MKYLIVVEGELYKIVNGEEKVREYLENRAKLFKERGAKNTDKWLQEMLENGFSHIYTWFPELVIPFDDILIEKED